jgi:hypothetical protein
MMLCYCLAERDDFFVREVLSREIRHDSEEPHVAFYVTLSITDTI